MITAVVVPSILHSVYFDHDLPRSNLAAGSIAYSAPDGRNQTGDQPAALLYICPCGCKGVGALPLFKLDDHDAWNWNGSREKPTLTPSVFRKRTCGWHGFLTDGVWTP